MWTLVRVDNAYHPQSTGVNSLLIITQNNCLWYSSSSNLLLTQYFEWTYHKSALAHHFVTVEKKSFPQDSIFDGINSAQRENFASFLASKDCTSREGSYALEPGSTRLKARTRPKCFHQDLEEDLQSVLEKNTLRPLAVLCEPGKNTDKYWKHHAHFILNLVTCGMPSYENSYRKLSQTRPHPNPLRCTFVYKGTYLSQWRLQFHLRHKRQFKISRTCARLQVQDLDFRVWYIVLHRLGAFPAQSPVPWSAQDTPKNPINSLKPNYPWKNHPAGHFLAAAPRKLKCQNPPRGGPRTPNPEPRTLGGWGLKK